jgi:proteasome lid subunit RPN8/RPN11
MITIEQDPWEVMVKDAVSAFPDECCGFLFGTEDQEGNRTILRALPVDNSKQGDKTRRFEISALDYLKAEKLAESGEFLLLGIYHSHPSHPAIPSEHDRKAAQPYFSYLILSVFQPEQIGVRSWRLNEAELFEEEKMNFFQLHKQ